MVKTRPVSSLPANYRQSKYCNRVWGASIAKRVGCFFACCCCFVGFFGFFLFFFFFFFFFGGGGGLFYVDVVCVSLKNV